MPGKKFIIYILSPLIVTIVAGILVFHYGNMFAKNERFFFTTEEFSVEISEQIDYRFYVLKIHNRTSEALEGVSVVIDGVSGIDEVKISDITRNPRVSEGGDEKFIVNLGRLRVNEVRDVQLVLRSPPVDAPIINVSSDTRIADRIETPIPNTSAREWLSWATALILFLVYAASFPIFIRIFRRVFKSPNDLAFVLLHTGSAEQARALLEHAVSDGKASVYETSNLSSCYSVLDQKDLAKKYLKIAGFLNGGDNHDNIYLAKTIFFYSQRDKRECRFYFEKFKGYRQFVVRRPYVRYREYSDLIQQIESFLSEDYEMWREEGRTVPTG